jgi:hypothetical protein
VNSLLGSFEKRAWVMVKRNKGGIKVEIPQEGPDSPTMEFQTQG